MEYKVIVSAAAGEQIREASNYILRNSKDPKAAQKWANTVEEGIQSLDFFPNRYPLELIYSKERGMRRFPIKGHIIYYKVDEKRKAVIICAVISAKRDQKAALGEID